MSNRAIRYARAQRIHKGGHMKAAIYCRLSDEDRSKLFEHDDSASIQNQKAMLIKYAGSNGWTIHDIYSDDDFSGADRKRPEFNRLITDATARKFDIVLCKSQSRFTRELELVEKYINGLFSRLGIRFISLADSADTDNKGNKKSRQINGLVNEWFLEELSDNIKSVKTTQRQKGLHIGPFAPYGYRKDPEWKGHLIIDPEAAAIVRKIFALFAEGKGKQAIARTLNEGGIPNPTEYKRLHGMVRNKHAQSGTLWSYYTISSILTNEVYIGNMIQGRSGVESYKTQEKVTYPQDQWIVVKGTHAPIIEQELWNNVQDLIGKKATHGRKEPEGIFARKVRCIYCGSRMQSVKNGNKRGFKCAKHALSHESCVGACISLRKLERIAAAQLHIFSEEMLDEEKLEEGIDPFPDLRVQHAKLESEIRVLQRKAGDHHTVMKTMYMDKVKGTISESDYIELFIRLSDEKNAFENEIAARTEQIGKIEKTLAIHHNRKLLVQQYTGNRSLSREMVDILIDYILVGKRDPLTKYTPVEIHWNF